MQCISICRGELQKSGAIDGVQQFIQSAFISDVVFRLQRADLIVPRAASLLQHHNFHFSDSGAPAAMPWHVAYEYPIVLPDASIDPVNVPNTPKAPLTTKDS